MTGIITQLISVGFPVLATFKALKSNDLGQLRTWLMYWSIQSLFVAFESTFSGILSLIPFYSLIRPLIAVWLISHGATQIWTNNVEPFLVNYEPDLEKVVARLWNHATGANEGSSGDRAASSDKAPDSQAVDSFFSRFSAPVNSDHLLESLAQHWSAPPSSAQANKQRTYLQAMLNSLEAKDTDDFVAVDTDIPPAPARKGWFW